MGWTPGRVATEDTEITEVMPQGLSVLIGGYAAGRRVYVGVNHRRRLARTVYTYRINYTCLK